MIENNKQLEATRKYLKGMEKIVSDMMKENIHPERLKIWVAPYMKEIRKARFEIDECLGITEIEREKSAILIHLKGPSIIDGAIPAKILSRYSENFQELVYQIAKSKEGLLPDLKRDRKKEAQLRSLCNLLVTTAGAGSFQIGFEFAADYLQPELFSGPIQKESMIIILEIASRLALQKAENLDDLIPNVKMQKKVLNTIKKLSPGKIYGIDNMEFLPREGKAITFDPEIRKYISKLIFHPEEKIRKEEGILRGLDLDGRWFRITRLDGTALRCKYTEEDIEDTERTIINAVDKHVIVTGKVEIDPITKKSKKVKEVVDIEIKDAEQGSTGFLFDKNEH